MDDPETVASLDTQDTGQDVEKTNQKVPLSNKTHVVLLIYI